jgi:hypothetical protein
MRIPGDVGWHSTRCFLRNFRRKCLSEKIVPEVHGSLLGFPLKCPFILAGHFPHQKPSPAGDLKLDMSADFRRHVTA